MQGTVLGVKDVAINKAIMISALMGPHSKIQTFTSLIYATKEKSRVLRELVIEKPILLCSVSKSSIRK